MVQADLRRVTVWCTAHGAVDAIEHVCWITTSSPATRWRWRPMLPQQPQHPAQHGPAWRCLATWMRTACARRRWKQRWPMAPSGAGVHTKGAKTHRLRPEQAARPRTAPRARPPSAHAGDRGRPLRLAGRTPCFTPSRRNTTRRALVALRVQGFGRICGGTSSRYRCRDRH